VAAVALQALPIIPARPIGYVPSHPRANEFLSSASSPAIDDIVRGAREQFQPRPGPSKAKYTWDCICVYGMTTIRLSSEQKEAVREASEILEKRLGRRLSQGEAVAALAEFALRNRAALANAVSAEMPDLTKDPFYDTSLVFDAGPTDARSLDRLLYGRR